MRESQASYLVNPQYPRCRHSCMHQLLHKALHGRLRCIGSISISGFLCIRDACACEDLVAAVQDQSFTCANSVASAKMQRSQSKLLCLVMCLSAGCPHVFVQHTIWGCVC